MKTFEQLDLIRPLQKALAGENYHTPTPIQSQTIPHALEGRDVLGCAQTGTGKTAAFALPVLNHLGKSHRKALPNRPFALVLAPTRELAIQIGDSFQTYGKHLNLRTALVYGGVNQFRQVRAMERGSHVLVATPGRLLDLMNQGHIQLDQLEAFVLDEADRMLDMGFLPDLKRIISELPKKRQSLFFSATLAPAITELSRSLLFHPVSVNVTPKTTSVKKIKQQLLYVQRDKKIDLLREILVGEDVERTLVFTKTKRGADRVSKKLDQAGIRSAAIHGDKSQNARQRALESFRRNRVRVLVATDVAARGIDIDGISHVVNFDLPLEPDNYVHRIGRTGRAGADGVAISFCTSEEFRVLREIEQLIRQEIPRCPDRPLPSRKPSRRAGKTTSHQGTSKNSRRSVQQKRRRKSNAETSQSRDSGTEFSSAAARPTKKRRQRRGRNARLIAQQSGS